MYAFDFGFLLSVVPDSDRDVRDLLDSTLVKDVDGVETLMKSLVCYYGFEDASVNAERDVARLNKLAIPLGLSVVSNLDWTGGLPSVTARIVPTRDQHGCWPVGKLDWAGVKTYRSVVNGVHSLNARLAKVELPKYIEPVYYGLLAVRKAIYLSANG